MLETKNIKIKKVLRSGRNSMENEKERESLKAKKGASGKPALTSSAADLTARDQRDAFSSPSFSPFLPPSPADSLSQDRLNHIFRVPICVSTSNLKDPN